MSKITRKQLEDAMWAGDIDLLWDLAPCRCCCHEHTFENCVARQWFGCRGQRSFTHEDEESWLRHYKTMHGMTDEEFYGWSPET